MYFYENIDCLFLGLTGIVRPNQNVLLGFYSFICLLMVVSSHEVLKLSSYFFREKEGIGMYNHNCLPQTMKLSINSKM